MKSLYIIALLGMSSAHAAGFKSLCGANTRDGEEIRLELVLMQKDAFSPIQVITVDGQQPRAQTEKGAAGFGFRNYESIELNLEGCKGTALYKHYNSSMPMNPMENVSLKCICK